MENTFKRENKKILHYQDGPDESLINSVVSGGTFGLLKALSRSYNISKKWNMFLINAYTLTRNTLSYYDIRDEEGFKKTVKKKDVLEKIRQDIEILTQYISTYIDILKPTTPNTDYSIIIYFPNYYIPIPIDILKSIKITRLTDYLYHEFVLPEMKGKFNELITMGSNNYIILDPKLFSTISLFRTINESFNNSRNLNYVLMSHVPLDYHLIKFFPRFNVMESHTGKILLDNNHISEKLFKSTDIPFNKYSHWLFGDKYMLRSNIPRGKRTSLLLRARKNKWKTLSTDGFKRVIKELGWFRESANKFNPY